MNICRSCGAEIDWVKTIKGKNMPVNLEYFKYDDLKPGDIIITDGGNVITKQKEYPPENKGFPTNMPNVKGRISHFSSCKDADKWRKPK